MKQWEIPNFPIFHFCFDAVVEITRFHTFFWHSNQYYSAVLALEFIEIGTDLYLILCSLEQVGEDGAALGGGIDVLEEPGPPAGSVEETVALDELRLAINLKRSRVQKVEKKDERQ